MWLPDATSLRVFRQCPELFRLRFRQHYAQAPDAKRDAGAALHSALDAWFARPVSDARAAISALRVAMEPQGAVYSPVGSLLAGKPPPRSLPHMERVLEGYMRVFPREQDHFRVVRNETYTEARIASAAGPFDYCAIVDRKITLPDASVYIMDTKSTNRYVDEAFLKLARLDEQLIGNVAIERANGKRCDGFYLDVVHMEDRTQTVTPEHFKRHGPMLVPEWRVAQWAADVKWTLDEIARLEAARGVDKPWPLYHNWAWGRPDKTFWPFFEQPPELHGTLAAAFERRAWSPREVAQERKVLRALARLSE
jgi:hypothetical protein